MTSQNEINDLIAEYQKLLIAQYKTQPNANAVVDLFIRNLLANGIYLDIMSAYDLDTAVGRQLDVIGGIVGVDRNFTELILDPSVVCFAFADDLAEETDVYKGLQDDLESGQILDISDIITDKLLNDDVYRVLIKYKIILNSINMSELEINDALSNAFGGDVVVTTANNMEMYYWVSTRTSIITQAAMQKNILPKPSGVSAYTIKQEGKPYFAFADELIEESAFFSGFADDIKEGKILDHTDIS